MKKDKWKAKVNVYDLVNEKILERLEAGTIPWKMPYKVERAKNLLTDRPYSGVNAFLLHGLYESPYYLTFNQAQKIEAKLKKGERGNMVVFWTMLKIKGNEGEDDKTIPYLRYFYVFNSTQFDSINHKKLLVLQKEEKSKNINSIEAAEKIVSNFKNCPMIINKSGIPCYVPSKDEVRIPKKEKFNTSEGYYSTLFHELIHSTGSKDRLDRGFANDRFGSEKYSKEELVAELGASFLNSEAGIINDDLLDNSAAYIKSWTLALKGDNRLFVGASGKAQKAVEHILGVKAFTKADEKKAKRANK